MLGLSADRELAQKSVVLRALGRLFGLFSGVTHGICRFVNFGLVMGLGLRASAIAGALVRFVLDVLTFLVQTSTICCRSLLFGLFLNVALGLSKLHRLHPRIAL